MCRAFAARSSSDERWLTSTIARAASKGIVLLALVIATYGIYLLVVGVTVVSMPAVPAVPAVPAGTGPGPASTDTFPVMMGVIPTIAGRLILVGLALRRIWLVWIGAVVTSLFAGVFVFSIDGVLVRVAAVFFVLLGVVTWTGVNRARTSSTC